MTAPQREALLALPDDEGTVLHHYGLSDEDLAAIGTARTPETRLGYALQLCALRYPGRHLRKGELLPAVMLDHVADQVGVEAEVIAGFARRAPTRYDQLVSIKTRHGYTDLTKPVRHGLRPWLENEAVPLTDGRVLLDRLLAELRTRRVVIPGVSVVERMAAEAMLAAERRMIEDVAGRLGPSAAEALDAVLATKTNARQSQLSWLREPAPRVAPRSLMAILDKLDLVRGTTVTELELDEAYEPRMAQLAREGIRYTAQAYQQMGTARRHVVLTATLRELERTLTDAAIVMFSSLVGRAHLRARKRLEAKLANTAEQDRERLLRVAAVLDAVSRTVRQGGDVGLAVQAVAPIKTIEEDAASLRRTGGKPHPIGEIAAEYGAFKRTGPRFLRTLRFEGRSGTAPLRSAMAILAELDGDWRRPLPDGVPLGHIERRWRPFLFEGGQKGGVIDRTIWELATYSGVSAALAAGDVWVPASRLHRSLDVLLEPGEPLPPGTVRPAASLPDVDEWLDERAAQLDAALLRVARGIPSADPILFSGDKLRFPKEPKGDAGEREDDRRLARRAYGMLPTTRITDVLAQVDGWTGFAEQFGHVSSGLPPNDDRAFLAALIAEATNLGPSRMAEVCDGVTRRALLRMQTWHMREETFRAALGVLTDAIHAEPLAAWLGEDWRASADGQAYPMSGAGEAAGRVNAHYGRDPTVKVYTTITGRYAPLHQTVMASTASEAVHALDGLYGHQSGADLRALHTDGGGVSDLVFAVMHLLGLDFEPRIPRLSDRRLYAFEPPARYGRLAPLFGRRLDRQLIAAHWEEIEQVVRAVRDRTVTPSLILRKLSAYRQQNSLAAALREVGRIERTLFTLRWYQDPDLRRLVTAELNKGEARNSLARAVAFHRLGRFRDRGPENQQTRAAALNLVTAAIILFNCRYLGRALTAIEKKDGPLDEAMIGRLSPLGWDRINLTGDYVWSETPELDAEGYLPLRPGPAR